MEFKGRSREGNRDKIQSKKAFTCSTHTTLATVGTDFIFFLQDTLFGSRNRNGSGIMQLPLI